MPNIGLKTLLDDACRTLKCTLEKFIKQAFEHKYGKRRGIRREARSAHRAIRKGCVLCERAIKAIEAYLDLWGLNPATAG